MCNFSKNWVQTRSSIRSHNFGFRWNMLPFHFHLCIHSIPNCHHVFCCVCLFLAFHLCVCVFSLLKNMKWKKKRIRTRSIWLYWYRILCSVRMHSMGLYRSHFVHGGNFHAISFSPFFNRFRILPNPEICRIFETKQSLGFLPFVSQRNLKGRMKDGWIANIMFIAQTKPRIWAKTNEQHRNKYTEVLKLPGCNCYYMPFSCVCLCLCMCKIVRSSCASIPNVYAHASLWQQWNCKKKYP